MPFISSSELCSRIKALYRKTLYLNNPFLTLLDLQESIDVTERSKLIIFGPVKENTIFEDKGRRQA